ncbi:restriction endonuclease subunit S [Aeromonas veronii]|nr:restriction endonuclease subunit S [Aeromonas veronii]
MKIENLITDHLDLWTAAVRPKSSAGRGSNSKLELTGIKKLRELILELAVRGKLVPQDPSDEPASVLLERIAVEKARLVKEKKIKQEKPLPGITEEEKLYGVPDSWCFCRLGDICHGITSGSTPPKDKFSESDGVPYLKVYNIRNQQIDFDYQPQFIEKDYNESKLKRSMLYPGDVVMNIVGPPLGKVAIIPDTYSVWNCNQAIVFFRPIDSRINTYIYTYLVTGLFLRSIELIGTAGQDNISVTKSRLIVLPVPPLAEQYRIVAKVDELMALCDQLEQQSEAQLVAHHTLVEALLATLSDSGDAEELAQNWARLSSHFDTLFTTEASIEALKQTILQLAVMGKLVPQDPSDEPASTLMERIALEKLRLAEDAVIKRPKASPKISEEEKKFKLPVGWTWGRLDEIFNVIVDCPHSTPKFIDNGYVSLDTSCFKQGILIKEKFRYVSEETYKARNSRLTPCTGDIVFAREGSVGESVVIPDGLRCCLGQRVMLFRPSAELNPHFLRLTISSQMALSVLLSLHKGIGAKHVNVSDMKSYVIALPPAIEQDRIVAKVDELMTLCNQLKSRLQTSQQTQLALAESLVEGALA